jgi:hypothetical protein
MEQRENVQKVVMGLGSTAQLELKGVASMQRNSYNSIYDIHNIYKLLL